MVGSCTVGPYKLGPTLGVGTFGKVKLAVHQGTNLKVAVKIINKAKMQAMDMHEKIRREISILQCLNHPHLIRLYELVDTPSDIFMAMEFVPGGELFDYIVQHSRLQEPEARKFFQQILSGVEYCHHHSICHRDLKPENILLDASWNVKIGDFGLSNFMRDGDFLKTSCGSPNYASPEVVSGKAYSGHEIDVWSCAVILYALLCGSLPFDDEHVPNLFKKIKQGNFTLPGHLSEQSRSLIVRMLSVDPVKRITFKEIRRHPWFRVNLPPYLSSSTCLRAAIAVTIDPEIVEQLVSLGYNIDSTDSLDPFSTPGKNPSRATVAYQLLADKKASQRALAKQGHIPFSFSRDIQKRVAAASVVVSSDTTPLHWIAEVPGNLLQPGFPMDAIGPSIMMHHPPTTQSVEFGVMTAAGRVPGACLSQGAVGSLLDWSPVASTAMGSLRWKLGIESSLESNIIMTAILNTLKALNYEWYAAGPYKIRCRPARMGTFLLPTAGAGSDVWGVAPGVPVTDDGSEVSGSSSQNKISSSAAQQQQPQQPQQRSVGNGSQVIVGIQLYKISASRYLIDVQLFDGPALICMSESLWLTSAIYSALTQIQLQDSPGSTLPAWSPSTPTLLGNATLVTPSDRLFG